MRHELLDEGYSVNCVDDGVDAVVSIIENSTYDFVLLDMRLPGIDGPDVLRLIKIINPDLHVIAFIADGENDESLRKGAAVCFAKPFLFETVKLYIRNQLSCG